MPEKTFLGATAVLFALVFGVHLARVINGWGFNIGGLDVPIWVSWVAFIVAGYMSWTAISLKKSK